MRTKNRAIYEKFTQEMTILHKNALIWRIIAIVRSQGFYNSNAVPKILSFLIQNRGSYQSRFVYHFELFDRKKIARGRNYPSLVNGSARLTILSQSKESGEGRFLMTDDHEFWAPNASLRYPFFL